MALVEQLATWQALIIGAMCWGFTQLVKTLVDIRIGREKRKKNVFLNRIVFPGVPVITGALVATFVPLHPEAIEVYLQKFDSIWETCSITIVWGGVVGMFSDYSFSKIKDLADDWKNNKKDE
jgi:hypothetical protein